MTYTVCKKTNLKKNQTSSKWKTSAFQRTVSGKWEKSHRQGENIHNTYIKGLVSRIYKERKNINSTQTLLEN